MNSSVAENNKTWLTTEEVGNLLGYSSRYVTQICLDWHKHGVKTYRSPGGRKLLFKAEEINNMINSLAVN